jgi:heme exporter protein A
LHGTVEAGPPALEIRAVARRFGYRWALRGVSLKLEAGEALILLGANGSGKTTLLRVVATALRPTRGEGWVYGHSLTLEPDRVRGEIGYFGYSPGLYDDLTALENLAFSCRMNGLRVDRQELTGVLQRVGLEREEHERARFFSAGMRRRLALARLLLRPARLWLLDEPYSSFDAEGIALINQILAEAKQNGTAVLLATHDEERVAPVADRSLVLEAGRVVEEKSSTKRWQQVL